MPRVNLLELPAYALQHEIDALQTEYVRAIDDDALEEWPGLFTERCDYRVIALENAARGLPLATIRCDSRGMLIDRVVSLRHANIFEAHQYRHLVCSAAVRELAADRVRVRSNYVVFRTRTNGASEVFSTGRYDDLMVVEGGRLLFKEKIVTFDTNRIDSLLVTPL
jgi:anthranilate 1,2-dioxygenase small subunit